MSESTKRRQGSTRQAAADEPREPSAGRTPIDRLKAPREWRSKQTGGSRRALEQRLHSGATARPVDSRAPGTEKRRAAKADTVGEGGGVGAETLSTPSVRAQPAPRGTADAESERQAHLPDRYHEDYVAVLIRDPQWCFVWWEVTPATRARLGAAGDKLPVLRFFDVTGIDWDGKNQRDVFDVQVHDDTGSWYVEVRRPGASFVADLQLQREDGNVVSVARSNRVDMPRSGPSEHVDPAWPLIVGAPGRFEMLERDLDPSSSSDVLTRAPEPEHETRGEIT